MGENAAEGDQLTEWQVEEDGLLSAPQTVEISTPYSRLLHKPLSNSLINKRSNTDNTVEDTTGKIGIFTRLNGEQIQ